MADSLEEQILDVVKSKLEAITTGNGYDFSVVQVQRASTGDAPLEIPTASRPALQIRHLITRRRAHLRAAVEMVIEGEVICIVDQDDGVLSKLKGYVEKVLLANKRWHDGSANLARRTWIGDSITHEAELEEDQSTGSVPFFILARADATNLEAVKEI